MLRYFFLLLLSCSVLHAKTFRIPLGEDHCTLEYHEGKAPVLVHLHENERTALAVIRERAPKMGNAWLSLRQSGHRYIRFRLDDKNYRFDPNRIFTKKGRIRSLKEQGTYSAAAEKEVEKLASTIQKLIGPRDVIALHNNRHYSIRDYLPGHSLHKDADALAYPDKKHFRDFFFVTQKPLYQSLRQAGQNVVQQSSHAKDDGSLSVQMAKQQYINIEAAYGDFAQQDNMLQLVQKILETPRKMEA